MLQKWDDRKEEMPSVGGAEWEDETGEQFGSRTGIGSYASKLQAAKQQGLGSDPDQVFVGPFN